VALAAAGAAVLLRFFLNPWLGDQLPLVTLFGGVALSAWVGGYGPALLAALLGYIACDWLIISPGALFTFGRPEAMAGFIAYSFSCAIIIGFSEALRVARRRADRSREDSEREADRRGKAEQALQLRNEEVEQLMHILPAAVWMAHDPECRMVTGNQYADRLLGHSPGTNVSAALSPDERGWFRHFHEGREMSLDQLPLQQTIATGRSLQNMAFDVELRDGRMLQLLCNTVPLHDAGGKIRGAMQACLDVGMLKSVERKLRESEERFRLAAEAVNGIIYEYDLETGNVERSRGLLEVVGYRPEEVAAEADWWHQQIHPEDFPRFQQCDPLSDDSFFVEYRFRHRDGHWIHLEDRAVVVRDSAGKPLRWIGCAMDVTERKVAEEKLKESEARYRTLTEAMPYAVWQTDPQGRVEYANAYCHDYTGIKTGENLERGWVSLIHPDDAQVAKEQRERSLRTGERIEMEHRMRRWDGEYRWFHAIGVPVKDAENRVVKWVGAGIDIHEKRTAEAALRASEQRLRLLWQAAAVLLTTDQPDAMLQGVFAQLGPHLGLDLFFNYMVDESGKSLRLESYAGISADAARSISRLEFGEPVCGTVALTREPAIIIANVQQSPATEVRLIRSLGALAYVCHPLLVGDRLLGTLSFASCTRDGFDPEELEFLQTVSQYVTIAYERLQLVRRLQEADRRKDDFLATLAHELRNPLAPIRNAVQVLKTKGPAEPELVWSREVIDRQVGQMARLLEDLLDVSRITRNRLELRKSRVTLASVVETAVETSRPLIDRRGHQLTVALPGESVLLDADPVRLAQVFSNLLNNAAKYTPNGGRIRLGAELTAGRAGSPREVVVSVNDTGMGISPEMLPRIFVMFSQAQPALDRSESGLGVGLALVKGLVEMHGGHIEATSAGAGKGSTFLVRLPVLVETIIDDRGRTADEGVTSQGPKWRILIVDDLKDSADSLAMLLGLLGHEVHAAYDGEEGVAAAEKLRPDVVLLDLGMPKLNGYDACRYIRQQPWGKDMFLIAVSGWGQESDRRRAEEARFNRHMLKPVDPSELMKVIESLTTAKQGQ
jgi:PAS domain S-box-containing protein